MTIPGSVRILVATGPLAHLTTLNSDGSPQVTVVWVAIEDDEIVSAHLHFHHKIKNIRRDPRVAVSLLGPSKNAIGLQEYLVVYGEARHRRRCGAAAPTSRPHLHGTGRWLPSCGTPRPPGIRDP